MSLQSTFSQETHRMDKRRVQRVFLGHELRQVLLLIHIRVRYLSSSPLRMQVRRQR